MTRRILPMIALLPFAACADREAGRDNPALEAQAPVVTAAAAPAVRPPQAPSSPASATPPASAAAPVTTAPASPLAPPPVAASIAVGEPNPATPAAEPLAARADGRLGTTVASLGSPADPGLWLETSLVSAPQSGRVEYNGQTVSVQLRPSGGEPGSGSQISLEAMRALGAPLTGLPELVVFGG